jgi:hypothetical protein
MAYQKYKPFMAYVEADVLLKLKKFAKKKRTTMTEVVREALNARLMPGDPYVSGFNAGIDSAVIAVKNTKGAQMRFPSGKTFAELTSEEIERHYLPENVNEAVGRNESVSRVQSLLQK